MKQTKKWNHVGKRTYNKANTTNWQQQIKTQNKNQIYTGLVSQTQKQSFLFKSLKRVKLTQTNTRVNKPPHFTPSPLFIPRPSSPCPVALPRRWPALPRRRRRGWTPAWWAGCPGAADEPCGRWSTRSTSPAPGQCWDSPQSTRCPGWSLEERPGEWTHKVWGFSGGGGGVWNRALHPPHPIAPQVYERTLSLQLSVAPLVCDF